MAVIVVPKESKKGESRVALTPEVVVKLKGSGHIIYIQEDAGNASFYPNQAYVEAGATLVADTVELNKKAEFVFRINGPTKEELTGLPIGAIVVALLDVKSKPENVEVLKEAGLKGMALEAIPRTTIAQKMDVLSSMSSIAGYKAVLQGADLLGKYLPMMMTAAGTIRPATVLVLGAGVAGLQAIATAKRLGAVVEAYDVRPAVKEQVQSLGARFVEVPLENKDTETAGGYAKELDDVAKAKQAEVLAKHVSKADIVITTALIPGRPAPVLIPEEVARSMKSGAVIIDLAAERGGNCVLTKADEIIRTEEGVIISGPTNLPAGLPMHASELFARNLLALFEHLWDKEANQLKMDDEITKAILVG